MFSGINAAAFSLGVYGIIGILTIALKYPNPTPFQYLVFRISLSMAAGGIGAGLTGFLMLKARFGDASVTASAGAALALIVYFWNPAPMIVTRGAIGSNKEVR